MAASVASATSAPTVPCGVDGQRQQLFAGQ